jgi:hypothetical protein
LFFPQQPLVDVSRIPHSHRGTQLERPWKSVERRPVPYSLLRQSGLLRHVGYS